MKWVMVLFILILFVVMVDGVLEFGVFGKVVDIEWEY